METEMNGENLVKFIPDRIRDHADSRRLQQLKSARDTHEFRDKLKEFAKRCRPIWIFGMPRTGSTWFCKYFMNEFYEVSFNEPTDTIGCSSVQHTEKYLNVDSEDQTERPRIQQELELVSVPVDRLIYSVIPRFTFKLLFDFNIVPQLLELFPQSRFVWLSRDGRDIVDSFHNPSDDSWPPAKFKFLGEDSKERYLGALRRFIRFSMMQMDVLRSYEKSITWVKYEAFTDDFMEAGSHALSNLNVSFNGDVLKKLAKEFDARHGMWEQWEDWQVQLFQTPSDSGLSAQKLNRTIGYGTKDRDAENVWDRPLPDVPEANLSLNV